MALRTSLSSPSNDIHGCNHSLLDYMPMLKNGNATEVYVQLFHDRSTASLEFEKLGVHHFDPSIVIWGSAN